MPLRLREMACLAFLALMAPANAAPPEDSRPIDPNGSLVVAWGGSPTSLDPHRLGSTADPLYQFLMYDRLTAVDAKFNITPMLAKSWSFDDEGSLVLQLREDVTFHDGTRFNAAAVKANLERGKTVDRSTVAPVLSSIEAVEISGEHTVRLRLKKGEGGNLPAVFASNAGAMISPNAIADGRNLALEPKDAGSGPYMPHTIRVNEKIIYTPAPGKYWDSRAGRLKNLEVQFVAQGAARMNGMRAGQFDVGQIVGNDIGQAKKLAETGAFETYVAQTANVQTLLMRPDRPALSNAKLRQAMGHAVDRDAVAQAGFGGNCLPASQFVPKGHWAYDASLDQYFAFDPVKARQLVTESGIANPAFEIVYVPGTSWDPPANIIQGMLEKVGIKATLVPIQMADAIAAFRNGQRDAFQFVLPGTVDPSLMVNQVFTGLFLVTPQAHRESVMNLAARGTNPAQSLQGRAEAYREIFRLAAEQVWVLPVCTTSILWAHKKNVIGIDTADWHFAGLPDLRYLAVVK